MIRDLQRAARRLLHALRNVLRRLRCCAVSTSMPDMIALMSDRVLEMPSMAPRVSAVMAWMLATGAEISSVALLVWCARFLTSEATTLNPWLVIWAFRYSTTTNPVPPPIASRARSATTTPPTRKRIDSLPLENMMGPRKNASKG